jgi:hypothetical protein
MFKSVKQRVASSMSSAAQKVLLSDITVHHIRKLLSDNDAINIMTLNNVFVQFFRLRPPYLLKHEVIDADVQFKDIKMIATGWIQIVSLVAILRDSGTVSDTAELLTNSPTILNLKLRESENFSVVNGVFLISNTHLISNIHLLFTTLSHNLLLQNIDILNCNGEICKNIVNIVYRSVSLKQLNLSGAGIDDETFSNIIDMLHHNQALQELDLSHNYIFDAGIIQIARALYTNTSLRILKLHCNSFFDISMDALTELINNNTSLQYLDLSYNYISYDSMVKFVDVLKTHGNVKESQIHR